MSPSPVQMPSQSPLFHAEQDRRYDRQQLIRAYEEKFRCRFVVVIDAIFPEGMTYFEELVYNADPKQDLHLMLWSPGGDGETAVRLARSAQARCRKLTIVIPDQAKSAATLLAVGAHHILMSPISDLGPIDPIFRLPDGSLVSAKDIIAAVDDATKKVQQAPNTYPIHASLLTDVTALMVQQARSALERTEDLLEEALRSNPDRSEKQVRVLKQKLHMPLIELPKSHAALLGADDVIKMDLPVVKADPASEQWQLIWRLWTKYFALGPPQVYEGSFASRVVPVAGPS